MAVEDIKGYKPHTDEKIGKVNAIKDAEVRLGLIFSALEEEALANYQLSANESDQVLDEAYERIDQIRMAKQKLKEASMWACRAVFRPEEKY
ncbi:hypothetical protein CPT_Metamorpho_176 [Klebsiella phage Metamorpho]|nr:hypothetical protein CPT_Metamorpho_176 [Klebsiella phage Metamorpho]